MIAKIFKIILFLVIFSTNSVANDREKILTIFSENEISIAVINAARQYSQQHNVNISINFDNSENLIKEIEEGEPAGIFISSHPKWIKKLRNKGLIDYRNFLILPDKELLLVTSKQNNKFNYVEIAQNKDIFQMIEFINEKKLPIIYDNQTSSIGLYSKEILQSKLLNPNRIHKRIDEDSENVATILENNIAYFSIISEDSLENHMQIIKRIAKIKIKRKVLIIAGKEMAEAKKFINYLKNNNINF